MSQEQQPRICPLCATPRVDYSYLCPSCGYDYRPPRPVPGRRTRSWAILLGITCLSAAAVAVAFVSQPTASEAPADPIVVLVFVVLPATAAFVALLWQPRGLWLARLAGAGALIGLVTIAWFGFGLYFGMALGYEPSMVDWATLGTEGLVMVISGVTAIVGLVQARNSAAFHQ